LGLSSDSLAIFGAFISSTTNETITKAAITEIIKLLLGIKSPEINISNDEIKNNILVKSILFITFPPFIF